MIDVNIKGVMNANRAIAPVMVEAKSGSIVNIGSEAIDMPATPAKVWAAIQSTRTAHAAE